MQRANMVTVGDADFAHAALENDMLSDREDIVPGFQHFTDAQCRNDITGPRTCTWPGRGSGRHAGEWIDRQPARAAENAAVGESRHLAVHYLEVPGRGRCPPDPDFEIAHWRLLLGLGLRCLALCRILLVGSVDLLLQFLFGLLGLLRILGRGNAA